MTAGGVTVEMTFGVADSWSLIPALGLGLTSSYYKTIYINKTYPSYPEILFQQGKIASQYCSIYFNSAADLEGQLLLGALDRDKFAGGFDVHQAEIVGIFF